MPSVRFSRDKRGYEYVYLVHTPVRRGKPGRTRVLYWYRTPPGVRIGRKPFDEQVRRTLEEQNPGVTFDWDTIINTPMPPPDMTEFWRERRRAEKAARQERRAMEAEVAVSEETPGSQPVETSDVIDAPGDTGEEEDLTPAAQAHEVDSEVAAAPPVEHPAEGAASPKRRRRRRGGRRRRTQGGDAGMQTAALGTDAAPESAEGTSSDEDPQSADDDLASEEE